MTYMDIQCCLPLIIRMKTLQILYAAQKPHIALMSLMCIIDNTLTHLFGVFPRFNSIHKCEQMMWILLHIL
jgi:hypothetical protein